MDMEQQYLALLGDVYRNGKNRGDRTGVGTRSIFGRQIRGDLAAGFPAMTSKKLFWKPVVGELLWFLEGSSDNARLAELTFGDATRDTIWSANANAPYWKPKARYAGDVGEVYGVQWRKWAGYNLISPGDTVDHIGTNAVTHFGATVQRTEHDQIASIVNTLKTNPYDRRMVLTAFNVAEMGKMALPPCHMFAQFYVEFEEDGSKKLSCQVYIRSNDLFLGLPFNIASYALLTHMMAQVTDMGVGELIVTIGDAHIYQNHREQVAEQLSRTTLTPPTLVLNSSIRSIDDFTMADISLENYQSHPAIKAPMAV